MAVHGTRGASRTGRDAPGQAGCRRTVRLLRNSAVKNGIFDLKLLSPAGKATRAPTTTFPQFELIRKLAVGGYRHQAKLPSGGRSEYPGDDMQRRGLIVDDERVVCELIG